VIVTTTNEREYVLGTHDDEVSRLGLQHRLWRSHAEAAWERAGIGPGSRVLDLGCGPGWATIDLAHLVGPTGKVLAVERSRRFLDRVEASVREQQLTNVQTIETDADELDLPAGSLDAVWVRWVFSFLEHRERVLERLARALRRGGVLVAHEYVSYGGMRLAPRHDAFAKVVAATQESWRRRGGEPDVGLVLPGLAARHGIHVRELVPITRIARPGSALWAWPETFFKSYVSTLVSGGFLSDGDRLAFEEDWAASARDPSAFVVCPTVLEYVGVRS
jgi:SAM-dependent methyltransferase